MFPHYFELHLTAWISYHDENRLEKNYMKFCDTYFSKNHGLLCHFPPLPSLSSSTSSNGHLDTRVMQPHHPHNQPLPQPPPRPSSPVMLCPILTKPISISILQNKS